MNFSALLTIIATLFLLMSCGFFARKKGIIDDVASKRLSTLIIKIGQPMMIISALVEAEFSYDNLKDGFLYIGVGMVFHAVMGTLAFLLCKGFRDLDERKITEFSLMFVNGGFIGFPILEALFGAKGLFLAAFFNISFHLFIWSWGIAILARKRSDIKLTVKKIFINLGSIPCLIGILLYMLVIPFPNFVLPTFLSKFFMYLSNLCTPISVLITGGLLATISLSAMFRNKQLYFMSFFKLLVFPAVACCLAKLLGLPDLYVILCTVMAGLPCASTVTMLAELHDIEPGYASQTVGMTSLLTTATLPCAVLFAKWILTL